MPEKENVEESCEMLSPGQEVAILLMTSWQLWLCRRLPQAHANQKTGHQRVFQQAPPKGLDDSKQNKPNKQVKNQDTKEGKLGIFSGVLVKWEVGLGIEVVGVYVYEMIKV